MFTAKVGIVFTTFHLDICLSASSRLTWQFGNTILAGYADKPTL